jgi:hypothetical protein
MPQDMGGKVIVTNTTTPDDVAFLKARGVRYLITTTPVMNGRSFGANMLEAAMIAVSGKGRALSSEELDHMLDQLGIEPQIRELT